ncbi:hypothetical protein [Novosphingobium sp. MBES04]|uniref:hypothetical protein n=1 Tax=Novosphingobium sp. MBES04 TaxID=1206458 RepID=UPI00057D14EF|nr:hypothetical protein [Novosphingobium sp. MBES04]GAM04045.1 hypothetical protein MBENS4_1043 [Novosphingobium sp. MBES04]
MTSEDADLLERRLQMQVYHEWARLARSRPYPDFQDMEDGALEPFRADSVIVHVPAHGDAAHLTFVGTNLRRDCGEGTRLARLDDVPDATLLAHLTENCEQCVANRSPIWFEAEFDNRLGEAVKARGILLPVSSDGHAVDMVWCAASCTFEARKAPVTPLPIPAEIALGENAFTGDALAAMQNEPAFRTLVVELGKRLVSAANLDGLVGLALVATAGGEVISQLRRGAGFDLPRTAQSMAGLARAEGEALAAASSSERVEQVAVTSARHVWFARPLGEVCGLMVLVALDRAVVNLANARLAMARFARDLDDAGVR